MNRKTLVLGLILAMSLIVWGGCAEPIARPAGQVAGLGEANYEAAFEAGLASMREHFAIEKQDVHSGEIYARPTAYDGDEPSERISTGLSGSKVPLRRRAWLKVDNRAEGLAVEVRVDIERRDTQDYQMYEGILAAEDLRMRTPAERRDTAGPERHDVWTFIRRDKDTEEAIIRGMRERLE